MKTRLNKRIFACFLSVLMLLSIMPVNVFAADATGSLSVSGLSVTYEKLAGNASTCVLSGTTITATAKSNSGVKDKTAGQTEVTLTNTGSTNVSLSFSYTSSGIESLTIDNENILDSDLGSLTKGLAAGESVVIVFASAPGTLTAKKNATLTITGVSLATEKNVDVTFKNVDNGSYTLDGSAINADVTLTKKSTESFAVSAKAASNYEFYAWYNETAGKYISYEANTALTLTDDAVIYPVFVSNDAARFGVGSTTFISLTDACEFAKTSTIKTVVLLNNGTVSGSHTIPAGITLLVPFDNANTLYTNKPECTSKDFSNADWVKPTAYRTLTLTSDAKITVNGAISISGKHAASNGSKPYCGAPTGPVGWVKMLEGSEITVNNGASLYVWGFIQGAGTVTAKNGAHVYENFQFTDMRGGSNLMQMVADSLVFPINQYYVQNIEVPTIFEAGAKETLYTSAYASALCVGGAAPFIGEGGMFIVNDGYIIKDYIEGKDRLQVDIYGDITMSSMTVDVSVEVDSSAFILPITNNITINMNSGTTNIGQSMALLPGVEMTVGKDATLIVGANSEEMLNDFNTGGYHLIVYDRDEWFYGYDYEKDEIVENLKFVFGDGAKDGFNPLRFAPGRTYDRTAADIKDAVLDVNGTIVLDGALYTTMSGAAIKSSEETGKIVMQSGSGLDLLTFQAVGGKSYGVLMNSASLMNGDGSYLATGPSLMDDTIPYTEPGTTFNYCAKCNEWTTDEPCRTSSYTVTWMNGDELLGSAEVEEGTVPSYPGISKPSKDRDDNAHYIFAGWETADGNEPEAVTGDVTYYAVFTREAHVDTDKAAEDGKHYCDECSFLMYSCTDRANDGNHKCDYDCGRVLSECSGGTATCKVQAKCIECGEYYGKTLAHNYNAVVTEPTCGDEGYTTHTCTGCGDSYVDSKVDALGHDVITDKAVDPTCHSTGLTAGEHCSRCDYRVVQTVVPALEHEWDKGVINPEPTCNDEGTKTFTCGLCGDTKTEVVSAKGHDSAIDVPAVDPTCEETGLTAGKKCSVCGEFTVAQTVVSALGHKYNAVVTEPTCTKDGYTTYTCSTCGDSYVADEVKAEGHKYSTVVTAPTCTEDGYTTYTCSVCGDNYTDDVVKTEGHKYNAVVTEPTCTEDGYTTYTCSVCGDNYTDDVVKTEGHKYESVVTEPTCYKDGYTTYTCSVCGDNYTDDVVKTEGHKYETVVTEPTCTEDGYTTYTCTVCDDEYVGDEVKTEGHKYNAVVTEPTCTEDGYTTYTCTVCDDEYVGDEVKTEGHKYNAVVTAPTCDKDGFTTYTCTVCDDEYVGDEVKTEGHKYNAVVTEPTCTEDGYTTYTCSACGDSYVADEVKTEGHSYDDGVIDPEPTCNDEGIKTFTCEACGDTYTEAVSAKGHTAVIDEAKAPDCENTGLTEGSHCKDCGVVINAQQEILALGHGQDKGFTYTDIKNGMHTVTCKVCDKTIEEVAHSFDEIEHKCVCGAVEMFKLYIKYIVVYEDGTFGFETIETEAPFGAKLYDIVAQFPEIYEVGTVVEVNDPTYLTGKLAMDGWHLYDEESTMPAEELTIEQSYNNSGWEYHEGLGYAYYNGSKYLLGWNYIEEDYDDVEGGAWYYFDIKTDSYGFEYGYRVDGITRVPYPTEKIDGIKYEADKETLDYSASTGEAYPDAFTGFFLFDEAGKFVNDFTGIKEFMDADRYFENGFIKWHPGVVEVEGEIYYFIGDVENGGNLPANGDTYIIRNNGADEFSKGDIYNFENGKLSGADGIVNGKYYENSQLMVCNGLTKINDKYIYVRYDGTIVIDAKYWVGVNDEGIVPGLYAFDADGYMLDIKTTDKDGIYYEDGAYYFYEKGVLAYKGLIKYSGKADNGTVYENDWIYVRSNGQLATGSYWTTKNESGELKTQTYIFDETGAMVMTNGIVEENGNLYYYVNGVKQQCLGLIELEGKFYYIRTAGELVRGREYWITNVNDTGVVARNYHFDNDGVMQNPVYDKGEEANGVIDGYYYENGKIAYGAGLVELEDGSIIYVRSNGQLATGIYWPTTLNGVLPAGKYNFGTDGRLVVA